MKDVFEIRALKLINFSMACITSIGLIVSATIFDNTALTAMFGFLYLGNHMDMTFDYYKNGGKK